MQRGEEVLQRIESGVTYKSAAESMGVSTPAARSALMRYIQRAGKELWAEGCDASDASDTPSQEWIVRNADRIRQGNAERDRFAQLPLETRKAIQLLSREGFKVQDSHGATIEPS